MDTRGDGDAGGYGIRPYGVVEIEGGWIPVGMVMRADNIRPYGVVGGDGGWIPVGTSRTRKDEKNPRRVYKSQGMWYIILKGSRHKCGYLSYGLGYPKSGQDFSGVAFFILLFPMYIRD